MHLSIYNHPLIIVTSSDQNVVAENPQLFNVEKELESEDNM